MSTKKKSFALLHRRRFLGMAGLFAGGVLTAPAAWAGAGKGEAGSVNAAEEDADHIPGKALRNHPKNNIAEVFETKVICREPGRFLGCGTEFSVGTAYHPAIDKRVLEPDRYMGWPTIAKTKGGALIVAFSGDRDAHVCPWGKTQVIRSTDNGKTWSQPEGVNNTPLDDRDAGIIETKKGTLLISWFTSVAFTLPVYKTAYERYARIAEKVTPEVREKWLGNWVRRSEDGGKTWQEPVRTNASAPHGPVALRDGRLLYVGTGSVKEEKTMVLEESKDDGRSWKILATFPKPTGMDTGLSEPHLAELASGKLIAMFRNEPKDRTQSFLLQSESTDGGKTWTPLHNTGIWGLPPHLIQLKNGWVLVVYGYRRAPYSQRACVSRDEGKTWDLANEIVLTEALGPDMGYPSSVQLDDDSILTVFYQADKAGGPTVVQSTHWKLAANKP